MILNLDIDLTQLPKDKIQEGTNGHKYIKLTVGTMRQPDKWGNDLTVWVAQTKDERAAKADRFYVGKGKTFGEKKEPATPPCNFNNNDLPF